VRGRDDSDDPAPAVFEVTLDDQQPTAPDAIESRLRPQWWQQRSGELGVVGVLLLAAVIVGYLIGSAHRPSGSSSAASSAASSVASSSSSPPPSNALAGAALVETGAHCADQVGDQLELGIEIANRSAGSIRLAQVEAILPLGGLRVSRQSLGPCGGLGLARSIAGATIPAGSSVWVSAVFDVLLTCPTPLPVQFNVSYSQGQSTGTASLGGFPDLGGVSFSGCDASS
jgi:hypothetical protein